MTMSQAEDPGNVNTEVRGGLGVTRTTAVGALVPTPRAGQESGRQPERAQCEHSRNQGRDRLELSQEGRAAAREVREARESQQRSVERQEREHRIHGEMRDALSNDKPAYRGRARAAEGHRELQAIEEADERDRADRLRARHAARQAYREVASLRPENGLLS